MILVRYITEDMKIEQRLLRVQIIAKSMTVHGEELARELIVVLSVIVDIGCFSHTLNLAGEHFKVPTLSEFVSWWMSLFSHSPKAQLLWKEQVGVSVRSYCATRWWSVWEVLDQYHIRVDIKDQM